MVGFLNLIYPPRCLLCQRPPRQSRDPFCEDCDQLFHDPHLSCPYCAATVGPYATYDGRCGACRSRTEAFDAVVRLGPYTGALRQAILRCKRATSEGLAELLGERWAALHRQRFLDLKVDVVVPIPLHWWRQILRGYNQAAALAGGLARTLGKPCRTRCLRRIRNTPAQKALGAIERQANVRGAFSVYRRSSPRGLHVLLVDDVMTTGATVSEAARMLRSAGAARISVAVLARADG